MSCGTCTAIHWVHELSPVFFHRSLLSTAQQSKDLNNCHLTCCQWHRPHSYEYGVQGSAVAAWGNGSSNYPLPLPHSQTSPSSCTQKGWLEHGVVRAPLRPPHLHVDRLPLKGTAPPFSSIYVLPPGRLRPGCQLRSIPTPG